MCVCVRACLCFSIALTKLDILDTLSEIKVGVAYTVDGKRLDSFPCELHFSCLGIFVLPPHTHTHPWNNIVYSFRTQLIWTSCRKSWWPTRRYLVGAAAQRERADLMTCHLRHRPTFALLRISYRCQVRCHTSVCPSADMWWGFFWFVFVLNVQKLVIFEPWCLLPIFPPPSYVEVLGIMYLARDLTSS